MGYLSLQKQIDNDMRTYGILVCKTCEEYFKPSRSNYVNCDECRDKKADKNRGVN